MYSEYYVGESKKYKNNKEETNEMLTFESLETAFHSRLFVDDCDLNLKL